MSLLGTDIALSKPTFPSNFVALDTGHSRPSCGSRISDLGSRISTIVTLSMIVALDNLINLV